MNTTFPAPIQRETVRRSPRLHTITVSEKLKRKFEVKGPKEMKAGLQAIAAKMGKPKRKYQIGAGQ